MHFLRNLYEAKCKKCLSSSPLLQDDGSIVIVHVHNDGRYNNGARVYLVIFFLL